VKLANFLPWRRSAKVESSPAFLAPPLTPLLAQYEAARYTQDRSWLPGYAQDARYDLDPGTRIEILRKARYFEKNHALAQKFLELIETNVVGTGITPTPASSDPAWNAKALAWWEQWSKFADLTSRQEFPSLQALIVRAQATDGEIFVYLTNGESGRPRIQLIEAHRVLSADLPTFRKEGFREIDGVLVDARGRPAFYIVGQDADSLGRAAPSRVAVLPAEQVVHVFEPSRAGQYRGVSLFHSILHVLHDLDDLQRYEMLAAKDASSRANIVYTDSGEVPQSVSPIGRPQTSTTASADDRQTYYEKAFGGKTVALRKGDRWDQAESQRPSAAMREFWEYLTDLCCKGVGISYAAVSDYSGKWGGAALRGAVTSDNRFYEIRTRALSSCLQRIYEYAIGWAINSGELMDPPTDWYRVRWQPPRRASVDIGRESAAILNELRAGIRTYRDVLGELGLDWQEVLRQRAEEEKFVAQLAAEYGVRPSQIVAIDPAERTQMNAQPAQKQEPSDE